MYDNNYEKEPIGKGNPYYRCIHCKRSAPEINGDIENHEEWCKYRIANTVVNKQHNKKQ